MKMKTVHEVSGLTGISVRTLHYYDEIGLLPPSEITPAGYRLYDDTALEKLQQILFFRELDLPLKEIANILNDPSFDRYKALENHRKLLLMKQKRLDGLLRLVDDTLKGDKMMSFKEFDMTEIEEAKRKYGEEAAQRWGNTEAFAENQEKTSHYGKEDWQRIQKESKEIFEVFASKMDQSPSDPAVQKLVVKWQEHITCNYYNCTKKILAGLGEMYVADERFTKNIDRYGKGLAQFMREAIREYCK